MKRLAPQFGFILAGLFIQMACNSYRRVDPTELTREDDIRVTVEGERREHLYGPLVVADTLIGVTAARDTVRLSLDVVEKVEIKKGPPTTPVIVGGVLLGVVATAGMVALIIGLSNW
jgi:hypothetical protein